MPARVLAATPPAPAPTPASRGRRGALPSFLVGDVAAPAFPDGSFDLLLGCTDTVRTTRGLMPWEEFDRPGAARAAG
jgi:hypothetical protein